MPTDSGNSPERFLRISEVINRVPYSRATIYRLMSEGKFPRCHSLGEHSVAWRESDITEWIESRTHSMPATAAAEKRLQETAAEPVNEPCLDVSEFMSPAEVSKKFRLSPNRIRQWCLDGKLKHVRIGRKMWISPSEVNRVLCTGPRGAVGDAKQIADKVIARFVTPELRACIRANNLTENPILIRFFAHVGKALEI